MAIYGSNEQSHGSQAPHPWIEEAPKAGLSGCEAPIAVCIVIWVGLRFEPEWIT